MALDTAMSGTSSPSSPFLCPVLLSDIRSGQIKSGQVRSGGRQVKLMGALRLPKSVLVDA
jgi:hypothetical protein